MKQNSIKKNLIYNIIYQILTIIMPLITTPYISRVIGPTGTGTYSYTYSIANYFVIFAMLGIANYGNRLIAQNRDEKTHLSNEFSSLLFLHMIISFLSLIVYLVFAIFFVNQYKIFFLIQSLYVLSALFDINWLFFGLEEFKTTVSRNIIIKIISVICIFTFVKSADDLILYAIILSGGNLLSQLALYPFLKKNDIKIKKCSTKEIKKHMKPLLIMFIPVVAVSIYKLMDKIMIGSIIDVTEVGFYEYAERIINLPMALITALGTVMLPRMSNLAAKGNEKLMKDYINKSMNFVLLFSVPLAAGLIIISNDLILIFLGEKYYNSIILVKLLATTIPIISFANIIRTQYLIPKSMDKEYIISLILGAIFNIVLNFFLIYRYKAIGACIATIIAELVVMIYQSIAVKRRIDIYSYFKLFLNYLIKALLMVIIISLINNVICFNPIINLLIDVIVGITIYFFLNYSIFLEYLKSIIGTKRFRKG